MAANPHVESLARKHARLDESIMKETQRPYPDQTRLTELKRQKLRLKEKILQERSE